MRLFYTVYLIGRPIHCAYTLDACYRYAEAHADFTSGSLGDYDVR